MSQPIVITIPHQLGRAEAKARLEADLTRLLAQVGEMAKIERQWEADVLRFSAQLLGQQITGTVAVAERDVRVEVAIPGVLGMIAQRLKGRIQREGQILLAPPKP